MKTKILFLFLILISLSSLAQGYKIKVKIKGVHPNDTLLMAHRFADKMLKADSTVVDKNGVGTFKNTTALDGGIYIILIPSKKNIYFEFLLDKDQQEFTLETDTSNFLKNMKVTGSELNKHFYAFQNQWIELQNTSMDLQKKAKGLQQGSDSLKLLQKEFEANDKKRLELLKQTHTDNPKSMLGVLTKMMTPIDIPEPNIPQNTVKRDSLVRLYQYNYNKDHFFDNFDFSDDRILRTPIYDAHLKDFLEKVIVYDPDSLTKEAFRVCDKSKANNDVFRFTVVTATNHFETSNIMGMDRIFVNLAERYYITGEAFWADSALTAKIQDRVNKLKPTLIGNIAPDIKAETSDKRITNLHSVNADFTIVAFYEPSCGHCKKVMPKLYEYYAKARDKKIEVFAMYTQGDEKEWKEFIEKNGFDWINVWDPYGFSNFRKYYDISSTPQIFLLDKSKKIIGKKLGVEQIEQIIDHHRKKGK